MLFFYFYIQYLLINNIIYDDFNDKLSLKIQLKLKNEIKFELNIECSIEKNVLFAYSYIIFVLITDVNVIHLNSWLFCRMNVQIPRKNI